MNYLDSYITEQTERNKLSGLVQEYEIRKIYNTVEDIPEEMLHPIIDLLQVNRFQEATRILDGLLPQVKQMNPTIERSLAKFLMQVAHDTMNSEE